MDFVDVSKLIDGVIIVPKYKDNDKKDVEERMSVTIKPMSNKLQRKFDRMTKVKVNEDGTMESNVEDIKDAVWNECVLRFTNANIVDPNTKEKRPMTPNEAYDVLPMALINEIRKEIEECSQLKDEVKKP